jgi:integrase/recombinase XerD
MTLMPELELFREHLMVGRGLSANTVAAYMRDAADFTAFSKNRLAVEAKVVEAYLAKLAKDGQAAKSQARHLSTLRTMYRFFLDRGVVADDPTAAVAAPKLPKSLPKALSGLEMRKLLSTAEGETPEQVRLRTIFHLLYASGLRVSELVNLTLADFDEGEGGLLRVTGKGGKTRLVPLGGVAAQTVLHYLEFARPHLPGSGSDWLFGSPRGKGGGKGHLTRQRVFQLIQKAGKMVGVKVAPHHLRHTFATHLLEHDADLRAVQLMLGHASLNTTQIYTRIAGKRLQETLERHHPLSKGKA